MKYIFSLLLTFVVFCTASAQAQSETIDSYKPSTEVQEISDLDLSAVKYFEGKVYLDGELSGVRAILGLDQSQIETIEVYKGEAAKSKYNSDYPVLVAKTKQ